MPPTTPTTSADGPICLAIGDKSARRPRDLVLAGLADAQHGVVSLTQLEAVGLTRKGVAHRVESGRLFRVYAGVFAVGRGRLTREGRFMAAVLACGPGAVLSHRSAGELRGLVEDRGGPIDVTAPNRRGRAPRGIASHRDDCLPEVDRDVVDGIPCTSIERTLLDFAAVAPIWELRRAIGEAEVLRVFDHGAARALIRRSRGRRGVARYRLVLDEIRPQTKRTRSELERLFLRMCDRFELPEPEVNVSLEVGGRRLKPDFLWRSAGLIMEADSRRFHATDSAFRRDQWREQRLELAGWRVSHCTWEQLERNPRDLAGTIRGLLQIQSPMGRFVST